MEQLEESIEIITKRCLKDEEKLNGKLTETREKACKKRIKINKYILGILKEKQKIENSYCNICNNGKSIPFIECESGIRHEIVEDFCPHCRRRLRNFDKEDIE